MAKIRIGADELILWLRKNKNLKDVPNDGATGLGRKIYDLIVSDELKGKRVDEKKAAYWSKLADDKIIGQFGLPQHSAQYEIDSSQLDELFCELNKWEIETPMSKE
jgi:hypothetical protein